MPEYRHNLITNRKVIIAARRGKRPYDFSHDRTDATESFVADCPFCPGNEDQTPPTAYQIADEEDTGGSDWRVRVFSNKFPFLVSPDKADASNAAVGVHEVLVESPRHDHHFCRHDSRQAGLIVQALRQRHQTHSERPKIQHVCIFCNHGRTAGASLMHPHFQIAAITHVPPYLRFMTAHARAWNDTYKRSVFAQTLAEETADAARIILQNDHFVAFCPYASMTPYEAYIVPKIEQPHFSQLIPQQTDSLTAALHMVLKRLDRDMNDADYNLVIHSAPAAFPVDHPAFRWYVQIYPRLAVHGGFELDTDIYVNAVSPEDAAEFYRSDD